MGHERLVRALQTQRTLLNDVAWISDGIFSGLSVDSLPVLQIVFAIFGKSQLAEFGGKGVFHASFFFRVRLSRSVHTRHAHERPALGRRHQ